MGDGIQRNGVRAAGEQQTFDARADVRFVHRDIGTAIEPRAEVADLVHDEVVLHAEEQQRQPDRGDDTWHRGEDGAYGDCDRTTGRLWTIVHQV